MVARNNPCLQAVARELKLAGIKYATRDMGKHVSVEWTHRGEERRVTIAATPSDVRAPLNDRAIVRRILCNDGFDLDSAPKPRPKLTSFEHVMSLPDPDRESTPDRFDRLEQEIKVLADLLFDIAPAFSRVLDAVQSGEGAKAFKVGLAVAPNQLGDTLTKLYAMGFKPGEVRVTPIDKPVPVADTSVHPEPVLPPSEPIASASTVAAPVTPKHNLAAQVEALGADSLLPPDVEPKPKPSKVPGSVDSTLTKAGKLRQRTVQGPWAGDGLLQLLRERGPMLLDDMYREYRLTGARPDLVQARRALYMKVHRLSKLGQIVQTGGNGSGCAYCAV